VSGHLKDVEVVQGTTIQTQANWWFHPPEKYESQIGPSSQLLRKIKVMFQTTNQQAISFTFKLCLLPGPSSQTCKTAVVLMLCRVKAAARVLGWRLSASSLMLKNMNEMKVFISSENQLTHALT